jgi:hypothetical protein
MWAPIAAGAVVARPVRARAKMTSLFRRSRSGRAELAYRPGLSAGPGRRLHLGGGAGEPDVRPTGVTISVRHRATGAHFVSEIVATAGLLHWRSGGPMPLAQPTTW